VPSAHAAVLHAMWCCAVQQQQPTVQVSKACCCPRDQDLLFCFVLCCFCSFLSPSSCPTVQDSKRPLLFCFVELNNLNILKFGSSVNTMYSYIACLCNKSDLLCLVFLFYLVICQPCVLFVWSVIIPAGIRYPPDTRWIRARVQNPTRGYSRGRV
jgi:hypothetical protein